METKALSVLVLALSRDLRCARGVCLEDVTPLVGAGSGAVLCSGGRTPLCIGALLAVSAVVGSWMVICRLVFVVVTALSAVVLLVSVVVWRCDVLGWCASWVGSVLSCFPSICSVLVGCVYV